VKKRVIFGVVALTLISLIAVPLLTACPAEEEEPVTPVTPEKTSILIGAARPITGANAAIGDAALAPIMAMWEEDVNGAGGIYLAEYGKSLPIEYLVYDDATDVGTMTRLTEKLIVEDEIDILFSACGTAFISAQAPIANKYEMVLLTAEGGATIMKDALYGLPYVFVSLPFSDNYQLPVLADMLAAQGAETAYIVSIADLHGVEYSGVSTIEFARVGIDILANVSVPITQEDFEPIIKAAQNADPDVFCCFAYPPITIPSTAVSMALGFNPDAFVVGPGANFGFFGLSFGDPLAIEGVSCFAAANSKTSPEFNELFATLEGLVGWGNLDWWGAPFYAPLVTIWQEALETTGTLDQEVLRDYIATHHFDTILGDTYFDIYGDGGGLLAKETHPGEIGQWQNGTVEIVGGGDWPATTLTSDWVYPKPAWAPPAE
jgi:branched-chain amino acid transport system substrate-binding protein